MQKAKEKKTIQWVVDSGLCTGCGTCSGICPNSAIAMCRSPKGIYIPKPKQEKCSQCGLCSDVCPGHSVDFNELNSLIFGENPNDLYLGNYINCYIGHAADEKTRYNASSGGLVTALLIFALEEGIIDGALVTRMNPEKPLEPESFIARTKEEIISASKSKYCPVPANTALKQILREDGRYAVVGLPCHIHGIRKAERVSKKLRERIVLHFGIFCSHGVSFLGTKFLLKKIRINERDIAKIDYRSSGWPGGMSIILKDKTKKFIPLSLYWNGALNYFMPLRCTLCPDGACELADLSFGDAWLPELADDKVGKSVIICRSKVGDDILKNALLEEKINITEVSDKDVLRSQTEMLHFKKNDLGNRLFLSRFLGNKLPIYNMVLPKSGNGISSCILLYLTLLVSSRWYLNSLLRVYIASRRVLGKVKNLIRRIHWLQY